MAETWFTSDPHLKHTNATRFRDFPSEEEMTERVIEQYNSTVSPEDTVYILGDICFGDAATAPETCARLNGKKHLVVGNHDTDAKLANYALAGTFESILFANRIKLGKRHFYLAHYPTRMESKKRGHIWCLHGHLHVPTWNASGMDQNFHVGWEYRNHPINAETIRAFVKEVDAEGE